MFKTPRDENYKLIDSGLGMKLEQFGNYTLLRPDPEAIWLPNKNEEWDKADFIYQRDAQVKWKKVNNIPESWIMEYGGLKFKIKPTAFKHTGLFPEQLSNWEYFKEKSEIWKKSGRKNLKVLNLFGYTGAFSMLALSLGHEVTHVDSSQGINDWLKENCKISNLDTQKLKIITDDVSAFIKRLIKRKETFDVIILDPPAFGHGTKKELWKIEDDLPNLIESLGLILSDKPSCVILSGYSAGYSAETYKNLLLPFKEIYGGEVEADIMTIQENNTERYLTLGIAARWAK